MNWLLDLVSTHTAIQAVVVICLICALGLSLAKIKVRGVSLGITYVFFFGILFGALGNHWGLELDDQMLRYAESFGLILFVYILGLQVGPGFVSAFRKGGAELNLLSMGVVLIGTLMALSLVWTGVLPIDEMIGVLCGATTNTPALGAAQQTLEQLGEPSARAALGTAITYPLGMLGVILALMVMRSFLVRHQPVKETGDSNEEEAFIATFRIANPAIVGHNLMEIATLNENHFVASRLWRDGKVLLPNADTTLQEGDRLMVITQQRYLDHLTIYFGQREEEDWNRNDIDWNAIDAHLISQRILITRSEINGRTLASLHLRTRFGVNVSRVQRAGMKLVATNDLRLRMGDRLTVIGEKESLAQVTEILGNKVRSLEEPNMVTIFLGIVLGLILGAIPVVIPGISIPVRLGLAGGPIVMGLIIGAYGPRIHMVAYTTTSASLMLRSLGLSMYLACLGLDAGRDFVSTIKQPSALAWIGWGFLLTIVPVMIMALICVLLRRKSFATTAGMLCGAMANPIALGYINDTVEGDKPSVSYATVYPLAMFVRVIIAQLIVLFWFA
ncbi:MAG: putative transporter [Bacteroidaceae bacterium]|nr:putative transporter [Bacteroidaceae bacterium]